MKFSHITYTPPLLNEAGARSLRSSQVYPYHFSYHAAELQKVATGGVERFVYSKFVYSDLMDSQKIDFENIGPILNKPF